MAWTAGPLAAVSMLLPVVWDISIFWRKLIVGAWTVGPALWLFYEWFYLLGPAVAADKAKMDQVSHQQSVVRALWAAYIVALAGAYNLLGLA